MAALCDEALGEVRDPSLRTALLEVRAKLHEPLRLAIAGSVSSGKSTLVNALLGRSVAPVDASDCTKVVTWFRFGFPERVDLIAGDGTTRTEPLGSRQPLADVTRDPTGVTGIVVWLSNERLRSLTLIDTPGLDSIDPARERASEALLGLEAPSQAAVLAADALVLLMPLARRFDGHVLERFHALFAGTGLSAANAAGVISKVDRLAPGGGDPWPVARDAARQAARDMGLTVGAVAPVAGLIASTAMSGALTEADARALATLAQLDAGAFDDALLSPADLLEADVAVSPGHRRRLLGLLDLYGIRVGARAATAGGATAVVDALRQASGFVGLDHLISAGFARRSDALKAHAAVAVLDRLSYVASDAGDVRALRRLRDPLDRLAAEPEFHELRLLEVVRRAADGRLALPAELAADLERIAVHAGPHGRLGLDGSAAPDALQSAAGGAAARWARWGNDPRRSPAERGSARDVRTAYEWIWHQARDGA